MMGFEEWNSVLRSLCGHYYSEPARNSQDAVGHFHMHNLHGVEVAEIHCRIDRIERTRKGIQLDEAEHLFLLVQQKGLAQVTHANRQETLAPGECILLDSTAPAELCYTGQATSFVSAHLPRALCLEGRLQKISFGQKSKQTIPCHTAFRLCYQSAPNRPLKDLASIF